MLLPGSRFRPGARALGTGECTREEDMDVELRGKRAVITGGSVGIGLAVAHALAAEGVDVAIVARDRARAEREADEIAASHRVKAVAIAADVSKAGEIERSCARVADVFDGIDILINNAGTGSSEKIMEAGDDRWQYYWDLHVMAAIRLSRALVPLMRKRGGVAKENAPIGRFATPEELAHFYAFLCSPRASYCLGSSYYVDGGWLRTVE